MKRKSNLTFLLLSIILLLLFSSCITQRTIVLEGYRYDEKNNITEYSVVPYGIVYLPGEWFKEHYNSSSFQQFFINKDSVIIAIAISNCNATEFNKDNSLKGFDYIKAFYEWELKYFEPRGYNVNVVEIDKDKSFLIWRLQFKTNQSMFDDYLLYGEKNCNVFKLTIRAATNWTEEYKIEFLKDLFLNKAK